MSAGLHRRLLVLETAGQADLPTLPALVVIGGDLEAKRAAFVATHGRPPELVLVIKRACARQPEKT